MHLWGRYLLVLFVAALSVSAAVFAQQSRSAGQVPPANRQAGGAGVTTVENCTLTRDGQYQILEGVCYGHRFASHPLGGPASCAFTDAGRGFYVYNCIVDSNYIAGRMALQKPTVQAMAAFQKSLEPIPVSIDVPAPGYIVRAELLGRVQLPPGVMVHTLRQRQLTAKDILVVACPTPEFNKGTTVEYARVANAAGVLKCFVDVNDDAHTTTLFGVTCESGRLPTIEEDATPKAYMSGPPVSVFACDPAYPKNPAYRTALVEQTMPIRREAFALAQRQEQQRRDRDNLLFFGLAAMLLNGSSASNADTASCQSSCRQNCAGESFLSRVPRNAGEQAVCTISCQGFC